MTTEHDDPQDAEAPSDKPARPSAVQTIAGGLTAITVTYLMSFLGVAGTIIGVGLVSVLTVLGNYLYSSAMFVAKEKVKKVAPHPGEGAPASPKRYLDETEVDHSQHPEEVLGQEQSPGKLRSAWNTMREKYGTGKIIGSIVAVFVALAAVITVVEMSAGKPLTDIVRNQDSSEDGGGTSFFGGNSGSNEEDSDVNDEDQEQDQEYQDQEDQEPDQVDPAPEQEQPQEVPEPQEEQAPAPDDGNEG